MTSAHFAKICISDTHSESERAVGSAHHHHRHGPILLNIILL